MRIEIVVDVPNATANSLDVIRYGNELARIVRNDAGVDATLVHAATGSAENIVVSSDFIDTTVRAGDAVADEEHAYTDHVTPHNEERDDNVFTPYNTDEPEPEEEYAITDDETTRALVEELTRIGIPAEDALAVAEELRNETKEHESDEQKDAAPAPEQEL